MVGSRTSPGVILSRDQMQLSPRAPLPMEFALSNQCDDQADKIDAAMMITLLISHSKHQPLTQWPGVGSTDRGGCDRNR